MKTTHWASHFPVQEDPLAPQQRLHKQLAEHLLQSWGPLRAQIKDRDLGKILQDWGARTRTGTPKGSRFTHSEFTFHLEPQAQAAQVADVPATSQRPE